MARNSWRKNGLVSDDQVTFVIQGPIIHASKQVSGTIGLVSSIRRHFPDSKIVVSSWIGENVSRIEADKIVLSEDPGGFPGMLNGTDTPNNVNRQIVSTRAGLSAVETKFTVKLRSDLVMTNPRALNVLSGRPVQTDSSPYRVLLEHVAVVDFTSIDPKKNSPLIFHPCDWIYGGRTEDIKDIFQIPSMSLADAVYFEKQSELIWEKAREGHLAKFRPEAFIWTSFLASKGVPTPSSSYEFSSDWTRESEGYLVHNLMIVSLSQFGFISPKYPQALFQRRSWNLLFRYQYVYTYYEWWQLYKAQVGTRAPLLFSLESGLMYCGQKLQATKLGRFLTDRGLGRRLAKVLR